MKLVVPTELPHSSENGKKVVCVLLHVLLEIHCKRITKKCNAQLQRPVFRHFENMSKLKKNAILEIQ